ncbi:bifunctional metallophosphatase/5'-nucleotidase [Streptomyces acidiscabies]|uniref:5'-nucleotidase C-terminal domain-containing protein n=1 Tax=Streptomyces acidiscabies TaxID=42234 RepID=A0AAP6BB54_9ACTN|nr:5'-nucleotidase C-terminal domain-containing protein [Streptomyces acidiscabies]MBP5937972.1 twin-arginine translocation signal domain-containing protein [Streptomyces sp. LBUM 1476]MBZ3908975.1 5'-nucleotidase C-terminal domain-containing protein [Streptomyces acidiscabies]MDX2961511.1 5'-nucleotidase C-terminal domain-containing protein [Streptomyces acidiscabies]MDX3016621.1 5'-nucleotidase C-terminal domain-containing protein [Streptomyces acidiscabies]MDX3788474.1 5'-nucleotidase C-ter
MSKSPWNRRQFMKKSAVTGAAVAAVSAVGAPAAQAAQAAQPEKCRTKKWSFSILGTTDLHSHVFDWDYYKDAAYSDSKGNSVGVARVATLIKDQRKAKGEERVLLVDAGDIIQGTSLAYYFARVAPITEKGGPKHPMAVAMNHMRYDAAALGNHEFNYGIDTLRKFEKQCHFPLLGANALDAKTLKPAFQPYVVKRIRVPGAPDIKVGILGLTNPGIALWDKDNVSGKMVFPGLVEQAKKFVPRLRALGCDVVFLTDHSGLDGSSSYGDELPYVENASNLVAQQVPGIDAILVGHTHVEVPSYTVKNEESGEDVLLSEPYCWGYRLSVFDFEVELVRGQWKVTKKTATTLNPNTVDEDPEIKKLLEADHELVVKYVNTAVGTCTADLSAADSCWKDVPIMDFIHQVQTDSVKAGLSAADAALPLISVAAPFSRTADIPQGSVTIKDIAGLYIYDNTLYGKKLTGVQLKDYLEYAAKYYHQVPSGTKVDTATLTNANNFWDYMYDTAAGVDYEIDIAQPEGSRIKNLSYAGKPVADDQVFVVAVNNYRANGGSGYPHIAAAEIAYSSTNEIRQLMIDYVTAKKALDPADFADVNWKLTQGGTPVF